MTSDTRREHSTGVVTIDVDQAVDSESLEAIAGTDLFKRVAERLGEERARALASGTVGISTATVEAVPAVPRP